MYLHLMPAVYAKGLTVSSPCLAWSSWYIAWQVSRPSSASAAYTASLQQFEHLLLCQPYLGWSGWRGLAWLICGAPLQWLCFMEPCHKVKSHWTSLSLRLVTMSVWCCCAAALQQQACDHGCPVCCCSADGSSAHCYLRT